MENSGMENLGKEGRDKITGYKGIIVGMIIYLFGCVQYGLAPKVDKNGKMGDTNWFDAGRIEIIGDGITPKSVRGKKPGGVNRDAPNGKNDRR
jgi:hypothetical protein